jgi:hypothetical protein
MVRIGRHSESDDLRVDLRTARLSGVERLNDEHRTAFAKDHSCSIFRKRAGMYRAKQHASSPTLSYFQSRSVLRCRPLSRHRSFPAAPARTLDRLHGSPTNTRSTL